MGIRSDKPSVQNRPRRRPGWEGRLARYIDRASEVAFSYGDHDCCLFPSNVARELTGFDPAGPFRGRYRSEHGAVRELHRFVAASGAPVADDAAGGLLGTVAALVCQRLSWPEYQRVERASRGDIVLATDLTSVGGTINRSGSDIGGALGICVDTDAFFARRPRGLVALPIAGATRAWKVG